MVLFGGPGGSAGVPGKVGGSQGDSLGCFENSNVVLFRGGFVNGLMKY